MQEACTAFREGTVAALPVKSKKLKKRDRYFHYLVVSHDGKSLLRKRTEKDIWRNLYEFPLLELPHPSRSESEIRNSTVWQELFGKQPATVKHISQPYRQVLTHQKIVASFWEVTLPSGAPLHSGPFLMVERQNLRKFAFPKIISRYLNQGQLALF